MLGLGGWLWSQPRSEREADGADRPSSGVARAAQKADPIEHKLIELAKGVGLAEPARRVVTYAAQIEPRLDGRRYWAIVDMSQTSMSKRLYLFDTAAGTVVRHYVSHGRGSEGLRDDGIAETFSNTDGSLASSLGIYRTLGEYTGKHGRSLRLEGLETSNSNALSRGIVIHTADYVSEDFIRQTGRLGRSEGCFAVSTAVGDAVMDQLKGGAYLIAWKRYARKRHS